MALPGEQNRTLRPPQRWRISIGSMAPPNDQGKTYPMKQDYFSIRKLVRQRGGKPVYMVDEPMQAKMCEAAKVKEKPTAIPISLIGNAIISADGTPKLDESIMSSRMAYYWGGRRICCCDTFDEAGQGMATRRKYIEQKSKDGKRTYSKLQAEEQIKCDPATCPLATGAHGVAKYDGVPLCKPHVIVSLNLPWSPVVGSVAKFVTTGWASWDAMRNSLFAIALQTNGWLHELPLWFILDWRANANGQDIPEVRFEFRGSIEQLRKFTIPKLQEWRRQNETLRLLQSGVVDDTEAMLKDPTVTEALQEEFYPEGSAAHVVTGPEEESIIDVPEEDLAPEAAPELAVPDTPPPQKIKPLFADTPEDAQTIMAVVEANGMEEEKRAGLIVWAWNDATGTAKTELPGPGTCKSPEEQAAVLEAMTAAANTWWRKVGHKSVQTSLPGDDL